MKNIYLKLFVVLLIFSGLQINAFAQAPEGITYQAEARDEKGHPIRNASLDVKIIILKENMHGSIVWEGLHNVTTNNYGMFVLIIGEGTSSYTFEDIEWGSYLHFLNVKVQSTKGKNNLNWIDIGTTQLLSVPYALHAKTATNVLSEETDPQVGTNTLNYLSKWDGVTLVSSTVFDDGGNIGIGTNSPTAKLEVSGQIKIEDGTQGNGNVLTSDANGLAHWEASPTYSTGDLAQGGYIFYVTPNGKHGLVAALQDQGFHPTWYGADNICNDPALHDALGQEFTDWRLPTKRELNLMYLQKEAIGGFELNYYWSSTESNNGAAWELRFNTGEYYSGFKYWGAFIRAVRAF